MTRVLVLFSVLAASAACGGSGKDDSATPKGGDPCGGDPCGGDPCGGDAAEDFSGWDGWVKTNEARFESKGHGKAWVDVWVEEAVAETYNAKGNAYPVGARLVKAQYTSADADTPARLTVMKKMADGYDPDNGNWFYGVYDASGTKAAKSGKIAGCVNCHDQADETDWVFGPQ